MTFVKDPRPTLSNPPPTHPRIYDTIDELISAYNSASIEFRHSTMAGYSNASCGISVLAGVSYSYPHEIVRKILVERSDGDTKYVREAFVMFSDTDHGGAKGGNALYKYIKDNNLGPIMEFGPLKNPNSGNMIKMWVWQPPHESLEPEDKWMPIYGKKREWYGGLEFKEYRDIEKDYSEVADDKRFLDSRSDNALETKKVTGINPA